MPVIEPNPKRNVKSAFFSTSGNTIPLLEELASLTDLRFCVTKKDTKIGRKQVVNESAVKTWCINHRQNFVEIDSLKSEDLANVERCLIEEGVELVVVADFGYIIPDSLISRVGGGMINIHFSLLPKYRGASPIQHTILNGDTTTGITFQLVHPEMDKGDILHQVEYKLQGNETTESLRTELFKLTQNELETFLEKYAQYKEGLIDTVAQDETKATYCYSKTQPRSTFVFKEDAKIEPQDTLEQLERKVRAFYPWPIAWITVEELENKFNITKEGLSLKSNAESENPRDTNQNYVFKQSVHRDARIKVYKAVLHTVPTCLGGTLQPLEIQLAGKNKISWKEFLNGYLFVKS